MAIRQLNDREIKAVQAAYALMAYCESCDCSECIFDGDYCIVDDLPHRWREDLKEKFED